MWPICPASSRTCSEPLTFGVGGVARSLRARSFFLSQITALFAWRLLEQLELPPGNLLLDAAGKFYLLFAPTPRALAIVEQARCEAAVWCLHELHGELALNVGVTRFPLSAFTDGSIARAWQDAQQSIAQAKQQKLRDALQILDGQWPGCLTPIVAGDRRNSRFTPSRC